MQPILQPIVNQLSINVSTNCQSIVNYAATNSKNLTTNNGRNFRSLKSCYSWEYFGNFTFKNSKKLLRNTFATFRNPLEPFRRDENNQTDKQTPYYGILDRQKDSVSKMKWDIFLCSFSQRKYFIERNNCCLCCSFSDDGFKRFCFQKVLFLMF